ncbi:MAG TPA: hypothetical protein VFZ44_02550 [Pyrinomonadaceae bacterium]
MKHRRFFSASLVIALALTSLAFQCGGNGNSNSSQSDPLRNAARASDTIAKSIGEMITVKRALAKEGKLTADEDLKLTQALLRVNTADKVLVKRLKSLKAAPDAATKAELVTMFGEVTSALNDLNSGGLLGVKNEEARTRLTTIFNTINASVLIIQTFIDSSS